MTIFLVIYSCNSGDSSEILPEDINVFEGNVTLHSQIDLMELSSKNYTKITGNLFLTNEFNDTTKIHDLRPLKTLKELGSLIIISNDSLFNLDGLENLKTINNELTIKSKYIKNIDGLKNLETIGEILSIGLSDIDNLKALSKVSNSIKTFIIISGNFKSLEGLPNVDSSARFFKIAGTNVKTLNFNFPEQFEGTIEIQSNNNLENLSALKNLKNVGSDFIIRDNAILKNLNDLNNLMKIERFLQIKDNKALSDLCGLNTLENKSKLEHEVSGNAYNLKVDTLSLENCKLK